MNKTKIYNFRLRMIKSRQKKLDNRWGLEQSAKGTRFKLNRDMPGFHFSAREAITIEPEERSVRIKLGDPPILERQGNLLHMENLGYRYAISEKWVIRALNMTIGLGDRVALVGANGEGKSTIVKLIVGEFEPVEGKIERHPRLRIGYFSQVSTHPVSLDPKKRYMENKLIILV
jgi:ATP-binding cassette subfamily F protein 3